MAGKPIKLHGKYYSRIYLTLPNGKKTDIKYPFCTDNKRIADLRWYEVQKYQEQIKEYGTEIIKLSWRTDSGKIEIMEYNIVEAVSDYIIFKQSEGIKDLTIERIEIALNHLVNIVGESVPVSELAIKHIDLFKQHYKVLHASTTININLAKITTFIKWLYVRGKIKQQLHISLLKVAKPLPKYITDKEWKKIMQLEKVFRKCYGLEKVQRKEIGYYNRIAEHWKRAFYFYRETGCRLIEPFIGELVGNWLIIDANKSKTGVPREIKIADSLIEIYNEMIGRFKKSKCNNPRSFSQSYSRKFKYACETIGIDKHFHCLRHTYAVRCRVGGQSISDIKDKLGHASVTTTEIYLKFNLSKLEQDFPSIFAGRKMSKKTNNHTESYTNHRTQIDYEQTAIVGQG